MKTTRTMALVLALLMVGCSAFASGIDWASMDDATIQAEIANAQAELASRGGSASAGAEGLVFIDVEGVKATIQSIEMGDFLDDTPALVINFVVENSSDKDLEFFPETFSINGWEVETVGYIEIGANHKAKDYLKLRLEDANISSLEEIENVEMFFNYADENYDYHYTDKVTFSIN